MKFLSYVQLLYISPYHYITCDYTMWAIPWFANPYLLSRTNQKLIDLLLLVYWESQKETNQWDFSCLWLVTSFPVNQLEVELDKHP